MLLTAVVALKIKYLIRELKQTTMAKETRKLPNKRELAKQWPCTCVINYCTFLAVVCKTTA